MSTSPTFTRRRAGTQEDDSNSPARPSHRETVYSPRPANSLLDLVNSESPPIYPPTMAPCQQFNSVSATQYPQFLMFGDSITEFSTLTLQPHLQTLYVRRMDVLNRGFGGYTSQTGLDVLRKFLDADLPSPPTTLPRPNPLNGHGSTQQTTLKTANRGRKNSARARGRTLVMGTGGPLRPAPTEWPRPEASTTPA